MTILLVVWIVNPRQSFKLVMVRKNPINFSLTFFLIGFFPLKNFNNYINQIINHVRII